MVDLSFMDNIVTFQDLFTQINAATEYKLIGAIMGALFFLGFLANRKRPIGEIMIYNGVMLSLVGGFFTAINMIPIYAIMPGVAFISVGVIMIQMGKD